MPKAVVPYQKYVKIVRDASDVAETIETPGWKVIERDLLIDAGRIEELLVENRLRTVHETVSQRGTTKTFITTAETQIAENAGAYKQINAVFDRIKTTLEAPDTLVRLESQGKVVIQKGTTDAAPDDPEPRFRIPRLLERLAEAIAELAKKVVAAK